ncbi:MAG: lysophospholipid acyltransferase family protein [Armatimonadota bacterium]
MIHRITWLLLRGLFMLLFRYRVEGAEHVPATGPVILASNHTSMLDPPVVAVGVWRRTVVMAKEELFRNALFAWYIRRLGAFPVKRGAGDRGALKHAFGALAAGESLLIFPEGTRSPDGELQPPEMGIGMIAYRSGAPVVPVYVDNTHHALPRSGGIRMVPVRVAYGAPLRFQTPEGKRPDRDDYQAAAQEVMARITELRDRVRAEKGA